MTIRRFPRTLAGGLTITMVAGLTACGASTKVATTTSTKAAAAVTTLHATSTTVSASSTTAYGGTTAAPAAPSSAAAAKVNINTASDAALAKVPGMTSPIIALIKKGRPFASVAVFRAALIKTIPAAQEAAIEKYFSF